MYAVIKTGGKQHKVTVGEKIKIEQIPNEPESSVTFDEVLSIVDGDNVRIGAPFLEGAKVTATVLHHGRGPRIRIFKMRRRKHYKKSQGHRQNYTEVRIDAIA